MIIHVLPQRSDAWMAARAGRLTSSCAADMLARLKNGQEAASRRQLRVRLALEQLLNRTLDTGYVSAAMQAGIDREAAALAAYEATGPFVEGVGFVQHDTLWAGASPDGLVGAEGLVEVKCPTPAVHLAAWRTRGIPSDHYAQLFHQLWITERTWVDWVSYSPDFPSALALLILRFEPDRTWRERYEQDARAFLLEVDRERADIEALSQRTGEPRVPVGGLELMGTTP